MLFDIILMSLPMKGRPPNYALVMESAARASHGRFGRHHVVQLADGGRFKVTYDGVEVDRLTFGICKLVFDAASQTKSYVITEGSDPVPLKMVGSDLKTHSDLGQAIDIPDPRALCIEMQRRLVVWNDEEKREQKEEVIGADGQPLEPPVDPGPEPRLSSDPTGIADKCEAEAHMMASRLKWRLVRSIVTQNAKWGVVWRGDVAPTADPSMWFRDSCWHPPHARAGLISISSRPLEMFDKSSSTKPLPAH